MKKETKYCIVFIIILLLAAVGLGTTIAEIGEYILKMVEVKATGKIPSEAQYEFGERVNQSFGSFWIWADSLEMFIEKHNNIIGILKK